jgi:microcystin-dependent protein
MATTNYSWNLPTVGGSEDTWGTQLNANWTALDTLLGGTSKAQFDTLRGVNVAGGFAMVPSGGIIMWSGSVASIPSGWFLCNGSNGTPDLRNRFVVGAGDSYAVGATGGADSVTLTEAQMPAHTHTFSGTTNTTGAHTHDITGTDVNGTNSTTPLGRGTGGGNPEVVSTNSAGDHSHTFSGTTASTGGGGSHENRPPYYALAYIMKA